MDGTGIHFLDARGPQGVRLYAIGDVHGCLDQLSAMFDLIDAELARDRPDDWRIILVGDYCDRGPDTCGVLELIQKRRAADPRVIALAGNHDDGLLTFLETAEERSLFVHYGGPATARSYGVSLDRKDLPASRDRLLSAIPAHHLDMLRDLPLSAAFGDFFFCHAGIRPGVPLEAQGRDDLTWIREPFLNWPELHPKLIVHGHTPVPAADFLPNRVNIDTAACMGGTLTALVVDGADKRLRHT